MREIKFRGISEETGEFIFGYLSSNVESFYIGTHGENYRFDEVKKESIGQFTGLYDKKGVEIYEGAVTERYSHGMDKIIEVVRWSRISSCFEFVVKKHGKEIQLHGVISQLSINNAGHRTVIGSIHLNPELLK